MRFAEVVVVVVGEAVVDGCVVRTVVDALVTVVGAVLVVGRAVVERCAVVDVGCTVVPVSILVLRVAAIRLGHRSPAAFEAPQAARATADSPTRSLLPLFICFGPRS